MVNGLDVSFAAIDVERRVLASGSGSCTPGISLDIFLSEGVRRPAVSDFGGEGRRGWDRSFDLSANFGNRGSDGSVPCHLEKAVVGGNASDGFDVIADVHGSRIVSPINIEARRPIVNDDSLLRLGNDLPAGSNSRFRLYDVADGGEFEGRLGGSGILARLASCGAGRSLFARRRGGRAGLAAPCKNEGAED